MMENAVSESALNRLFLKARTYNEWSRPLQHLRINLSAACCDMRLAIRFAMNPRVDLTMQAFAAPLARYPLRYVPAADQVRRVSHLPCSAARAVVAVL
jgi:hypothetical protein